MELEHLVLLLCALTVRSPRPKACTARYKPGSPAIVWRIVAPLPLSLGLRFPLIHRPGLKARPRTSGPPSAGLTESRREGPVYGCDVPGSSRKSPDTGLHGGRRAFEFPGRPSSPGHDSALTVSAATSVATVVRIGGARGPGRPRSPGLCGDGRHWQYACHHERIASRTTRVASDASRRAGAPVTLGVGVLTPDHRRMSGPAGGPPRRRRGSPGPA